MTTTMQLIAKQTVGSGGATSVTFSSIPQTFTDLKVVMSARGSGSAVSQIQFNGSASNRSNIRLYGNGSVTASYSGSDVFTYLNRSSYTASTFDSSEIYIPNYTSSNFKSISIDNVQETNATALDMQLQAGLWSQTAAITSLGFVPDSGQSFVEFSEFTLYGISSNTTTQASTVPYASGGDIIRTDGSFWYHTFLYSGTFTPLKALTCDLLVVGGGAGARCSAGKLAHRPLGEIGHGHGRALGQPGVCGQFAGRGEPCHAAAAAGLDRPQPAAPVCHRPRHFCVF
jgi:hypothetical protein